jgi:hypothetical protein
VDPGLHGQQEVPGRRRQREERRVQAGEGRRAGEQAEVVEEVVGVAAGCLRGSSYEREEPFVGVCLAEQVDRLLGEDVARDVGAVPLSEVVAQTGEDDAVQALILRRYEGTGSA